MGLGLNPAMTNAGQQPTSQPALASNPAPPQPAQTQSPMQQTPPPTQQSGKMGGMSQDIQKAMNPPDPAQTQGSTPQMGQPNQYAQTIGMGNNTGSQTPSPVGAGGKSGKGG